MDQYLATPFYSKHSGFFDLYVYLYKTHMHACLILCTHIYCALKLTHTDVFSQTHWRAAHKDFFLYSHQVLCTHTHTHTYYVYNKTYHRLGLWATAPMFFLQLLLSNIQVSFKSWHSYIFISFYNIQEDWKIQYKEN